MAVSRYVRAVDILYMSDDVMCNKCFFFLLLFFLFLVYFSLALGLNTVCQVQAIKLKTWPSSVTETAVCTEEVVLRFCTTPTLYVACYPLPSLFIVNVRSMIV